MRARLVALAVLHACGADINARKEARGTRPHFSDGCTALFFAVYAQQVEAARWLVRAGADVDARASLAPCPLHAACDQGRRDIVLLLLEEGHADATVLWKGRTPLLFAAMRGHEWLVTRLLRYPRVREEVVCPPLHAAVTPLYAAARYVPSRFRG